MRELCRFGNRHAGGAIPSQVAQGRRLSGTDRLDAMSLGPRRDAGTYRNVRPLRIL